MINFRLMKILPHIKIKELRKLNEFSQQYIANKLNISQEAYSKIERNKTRLNWDKLNQLSEILNVNIWDLIDNNKEIDNINFANVFSNEPIHLLKQLFHKHDCQINTLKEEITSLREQLDLKE